MSRITGSDALKMFEAYAEVYASAESASDEQIEEVIEDVEQLDEAPKGVSADVGGVKVGVTDPKTDVGARAGRALTGAMGRIGSVLGQFGRSAETAIQRAGGYNVPTAANAKVKPRETAAEREARISRSQDAAIAAAEKSEKTRKSLQTTTSTPRPTAAVSRPQTSKVVPTTSKPALKPTGTPMQQWASNFPKLAAKVTPSGTQMGTGQSQMSKQAAELRAMRAASQLRQQGANVTGSEIKNVSIEKPKSIKASYEYDAYDLVLEYLINNGHAETVDEAHYIMLEMDSEMIGSIVSEGNK